MSATLSSHFPPEPAVTMPEPLQTIFLWATLIAAMAVLAWSVFLARQHRTAAPVLMVLGGFVAIILEPIVTFLGHAIHPVENQIMLFASVGRAIPWHIALGYTAGFGIVYLILYRAWVAGTLSAKLIWKTMIITAVAYFVGEAYPVSNGLWIYYGHQPLRIWDGTAPLTWNWLNACCMLTSSALMLLALRYLKGIGMVLLVPLAAVGAFMGHMGAGFPMYNAMNSGVTGIGVELAGAASVALALILIWLCSKVLLDLQPRQASLP